MPWIKRLIYRFTSPAQRRFIKFCVVGASGVPVNLLFTWLAHSILFVGLTGQWRNASAYLLGIAVSILTNFLLNDVWTWGDRDKNHGSFWSRLARFYIVCSLASVLQFGAAMALSSWAGLHYLVAQLIGIVLATGVNFAVNNLWTFRARRKAAD
jgi:dolichol-phosphate mannosyltransferase